eukprot:359501-Chlamydomonas_euryale.AAC.2
MLRQIRGAWRRCCRTRAGGCDRCARARRQGQAACAAFHSPAPARRSSTHMWATAGAVSHSSRRSHLYAPSARTILSHSPVLRRHRHETKLPRRPVSHHCQTYQDASAHVSPRGAARGRQDGRLAASQVCAQSRGSE